MKKILLFTLSLCLGVTLLAQKVARDRVVFEIFTGVNCPYCPAAANGATDMAANGHSVAIAEYHTSAFSIPQFYTSETIARAAYYGVTSYPTTKVDGIINHAGGGSSGTLYNAYLGYYNQRIGVESDFTINLTFEQISGDNYKAIAVVENVGGYTGNATLQIVLTESHIPYSWYGIPNLHWVARDMMPDQNGTTLDFSGGNAITIEEEYSIENMPRENCEVIAFIQNNSSKEILQGAWVTMMVPDYTTDAAIADAKNIPTGICSGVLAPEVEIQNMGADALVSVKIKTKINGTEVNSFDWTGDIIFPEKAIVQIPEFPFNASAPYTIEFEVAEPNGGIDENPDDNTLTVDAAEAENIGDQLQLILKTDDHPEDLSVDIINSATGVVEETLTFPTANTLTNTTIDLQTPGCHQLVLRDEAGNGINSFWTLMASGTVIANGTAADNFWFTKTVEFNVEMAGLFAMFTADITDGCDAGLVVNFSDMSTGGATSWDWSFPGGDPATSTDQNPSVSYDAIGDYDVTLEVGDGSTTNEMTIENYINIYPLPDVTFAEFTYPGGYDAFCYEVTPAIEYVLEEGSPAGGIYSGTGVVDGIFYPDVAGVGTHTITYTYTDGNNCENSADRDAVVDVCESVEVAEENTLKLFPNPASNELTLQISETGTYSIKMVNTVGKVVMSQSNLTVNGQYNETIDISAYADGVYFIMINDGTENIVSKLIIRK